VNDTPVYKHTQRMARGSQLRATLF
jgi:hypothetical protein